MSSLGQMSLAPQKRVNYPTAVPDSAGIPDTVRDDVLVAPYNDLSFVESLMAEHGDTVAGIIVEPLQRIIPPAPGFLEGLRAACDANGSVLIFDEVVTGFRFAYGGAQELYGVTPDLCTMGKVIGGGFALAAAGGKKDIMVNFDKAKAGDKFLMQVGTLSGNPIASVAGMKTLEILRRPGQYELLREKGTVVWNAISEHLTAAGHAHQIVGDPVLFDVVFTDKPVKNYRDSVSGDPAKQAAFNARLREKGILKPPQKFYISLALNDADLDQTIEAVAYAARNL